MYCPTKAILFFVFFSFTLAVPASFIEGPRNDASKALPSKVDLSSVEAQEKPVTKSSSALQKRFWADMGGGWTIEVNDWGFLWPIEHAAEQIGDLHATIWRNINQEYQFLDERQHLLFRSGFFQLRFDCEQAPMEWPTIAMLVDMIASAAVQGWQGTYRLTLRHRAQGIAISAALSVMWYGAGG